MYIHSAHAFFKKWFTVLRLFPFSHLLEFPEERIYIERTIL